MIDPLAFERLDAGSFKAFVAAASTLNFTKAAEKAAMTQSGVSQHVARLERQLGDLLFVRIRKNVRLTKAGELLLAYLARQKESTDELFEQIHGESGRIGGLVRYAMPHSRLFTPHFSLMLKERKSFGEVALDVSLCPNEEVLQKLLDQQIDFGFVTKKENNQAIHFDFFCKEEYILAGSPDPRLAKPSPQSMLKTPFVSYPGADVLYELWSRRQFGSRAPSFDSLNVVGRIGNLHGAITMLRHGVGLAVLPKHCVQNLIKKRQLAEWAGPNRRPLLNDVSIVTLARASLPRRVRVVIETFRRMKKHEA